MSITIDTFHPVTILGVVFTFLLVVALFYVFVRPLFPVYVTCWFCDYQTKVPYGNQNCWDCPDCEQYNGFSKDGDYNKAIPAQFDEDLNHQVGCKQDKFLIREDVLCDVCLEKQEAKLQQLAIFNPSKRNFEKELKEFSQYLEEFYRLCFTCERRVEQQVREQDNIIWSRLNDSLRSRLFRLQTEKHLNSKDLVSNYHYRVLFSQLFHTIEVLSSFGLALRQIQLDSDQSKVIKTYIPQIFTLHPYLLFLDRYTWHLVICLILSGMLAKVILTRERICKPDLINSVFLLLVLISQAHIFQAFQTGSMLEAAIFVGCHLTSIVCTLITRGRYNSKFVYQQGNDVKPVREDSSPTKFSSTNQTSKTSSPSHSTINQAIHSRSPVQKTSCEQQKSPNDKACTGGLRQEDEPSLNYSYTVYKFESCNLGVNNHTRTGGLSRSLSVCSQHSNKSTYAEALSSQTVPDPSKRHTRSPLISPSRFTPTCQMNHQGPSLDTHGLFSTTPKQGHTLSHQKSLNHSSSSAFNPYSRSLTPPVVTRFGASPYSFTSIYSDRHMDSHDKSENSSNGQRSLHRSDSFKCLRVTNTDIIDDISDNDSVGSNSDNDDSVSDFTSVSQWCRRSVSAQTSDSIGHSTLGHHVKAKKGSPAKRNKLYPWMMAAILLVLLPSVLSNGLIFT